MVPGASGSRMEAEHSVTNRCPVGVCCVGENSSHLVDFCAPSPALMPPCYTAKPPPVTKHQGTGSQPETNQMPARCTPYVSQKQTRNQPETSRTPAMHQSETCQTPARNQADTSRTPVRNQLDTSQKPFQSTIPPSWTGCTAVDCRGDGEVFTE